MTHTHTHKHIHTHTQAHTHAYTHTHTHTRSCTPHKRACTQLRALLAAAPRALMLHLVLPCLPGARGPSRRSHPSLPCLSPATLACRLQGIAAAKNNGALPPKQGACRRAAAPARARAPYGSQLTRLKCPLRPGAGSWGVAPGMGVSDWATLVQGGLAALVRAPSEPLRAPHRPCLRFAARWCSPWPPLAARRPHVAVPPPPPRRF